jgi:hypothetical protein
MNQLLDFGLMDFAVVAYVIVGIGLIAQGIRYLIAGQVMHYHADVIKGRWSDLEPSERRLMLGVVFSAAVPLRSGLYMAHWFLAMISIVYTGLLVHVTRGALLPGAAPIHVTATMFALCVTGAVASIISKVWLG